MGDILFDIILEIVLWVLFDLIIFPLMIVLATPYILVVSIFAEGGYLRSVKNYYHRIYSYWWRKWVKPSFA